MSILLASERMENLARKIIDLNKLQSINYCPFRQDEINLMWGEYLKIYLPYYQEWFNFGNFWQPKKLLEFVDGLLFTISLELPEILPKKEFIKLSDYQKLSEIERSDLLSCYQEMQCNPNFTKQDIGYMAEMVLTNKGLSLSQVGIALEHFLNIGRYNFFQSFDEFDDFIFEVNIVKGSIELNRHLS